MHIHTTDTPAKLLGKELSECINMHGGDVVCLLSGGSALEVVKHINISNKLKCHECRTTESTSQNIVEQSSPYFECRSTETTSSGIVANQKICSLPECRTIFMMGDERWSREQKVNNTLQLQACCPDHLITKSLIETIPNENESLEDFATRIEKIFLEKISELRNLKIFMILGIGADGHTAGIFPLPNESFQKVYQDDLTYVPVHAPGLKIDSRASLTPSWILDHVDELFAYVVGQSKQTILESLQNETKELHERPAELLKLHKHSHIYTDLALAPK